MGKFNLGESPKDFKCVVEIPMVSGGVDEITMTFKYRSQREYAKMIDKVIAKESKQPDGSEVIENLSGGAVTVLDYIKGKFVDSSAVLMTIASGWDLEEPFNKVNIEKMNDMFPAAVEAINAAYRDACLQGRLKN